MKKIAFLFSILLLSGCTSLTSRVYLTYHSNPTGAMVYEGDRNLGMTPVRIEYPVTNEDRKNKYMLCRGVKAVWVSGAETPVENPRCTLSGLGLEWDYTFKRPNDAPNLDKDLQFALEVERNELMRRQAEAGESQAFWQRYEALKPKEQTIIKKTIIQNR